MVVDAFAVALQLYLVHPRAVEVFIVGEGVTETAIAGGTVVEISAPEQEGDKGQSSPESHMSGLSYGRWTQLMNSILRLI